MTGTKADTWKWIAGALLALLMFMLGGFVESLVGLSRLDEHVRQAGHPLMIQRVEDLEQRIEIRLGEISRRLGRIEEKLDQ